MLLMVNVSSSLNILSLVCVERDDISRPSPLSSREEWTSSLQEEYSADHSLFAPIVKGKTKAPVEEDDEEEELRKLQAEMAM